MDLDFLELQYVHAYMYYIRVPSLVRNRISAIARSNASVIVMPASGRGDGHRDEVALPPESSTGLKYFPLRISSIKLDRLSVGFDGDFVVFLQSCTSTLFTNGGGGGGGAGGGTTAAGDCANLAGGWEAGLELLISVLKRSSPPCLSTTSYSCFFAFGFSDSIWTPNCANNSCKVLSNSSTIGCISIPFMESNPTCTLCLGRTK